MTLNQIEAKAKELAAIIHEAGDDFDIYEFLNDSYAALKSCTMSQAYFERMVQDAYYVNYLRGRSACDMGRYVD